VENTLFILMILGNLRPRRVLEMNPWRRMRNTVLGLALIVGLAGCGLKANIHPAMKMSGLGLGGASMEAEGTDSQTKDRVFAVTDSQHGPRRDITGGLQWYGNAKGVKAEWAKRLVARLDEAHGKVK